METPLDIFFSYAHADEKWKDLLVVHLSSLRREGLINPWHDRDITAGSDWADDIDEHLKSAHIILLLVSPHFIASDYCWSKEVDLAMQRHSTGEARVIPVVIRTTDWANTPFHRLQALPTDAKPVSKWADEDDALVNVTLGIRRAIAAIKKK